MLATHIATLIAPSLAHSEDLGEREGSVRAGNDERGSRGERWEEASGRDLISFVFARGVVKKLIGVARGVKKSYLSAEGS